MTAFSQLDNEARKEYWAALALRNTPGLGARRICALLRRFGSAYEAFFNRQRWGELSPALQQAASAPEDAWRAKAKPEWDAARAMDAEIILWTDETYPTRLRHIPDAPVLLYARGNLSLLKAPMVAIVGSRQCSAVAADIAARMAEGLSESGITVVSGMAAGIDGYAQRAALRHPGRSIAVLGTGIDVVYPASNSRLYEDLCRTGLVLTEEPPHAKAQPGSFPVRNRIISGLSLGILVGEAVSVKSGSLITSSLAAEYGRSVYVPAPDLFRGSVKDGTKKLIEEGAMQVYRAEDIIADLFPQLAAGKTRQSEPAAEAPKEDPPEHSPDMQEAETPKAPEAPSQPGAAAADAASKDELALRRRIEDEEEHKPRAVPLAHRPILKVPKAPSMPMTEEENAILSILQKNPCAPDDLLYAARESYAGINWSAQSLNAVLMILEVKKLVRRLPDSRYEAAQ